MRTPGVWWMSTIIAGLMLASPGFSAGEFRPGAKLGESREMTQGTRTRAKRRQDRQRAKEEEEKAEAEAKEKAAAEAAEAEAKRKAEAIAANDAARAAIAAEAASKRKAEAVVADDVARAEVERVWREEFGIDFRQNEQLENSLGNNSWDRPGK